MDSFVQILAKPEEAHLPLAVASIASHRGRHVLSEVESVTARRCPWSSEVFRFLHFVEESMFTLALLAWLDPVWSSQMKNLVANLINDEAGYVLSAELVLVGSIAVIGAVAGMTQVRGALVEEYDDLAESISSVDQSYSYGGFKGCKSFTAGSAYYEDGREVEIEFTEIYSDNKCVKPAPRLPEVCPPQHDIIIEPLPGPVIQSPCNDCLPSKPCNDCLPRQVIEEPCCPKEIQPLPVPFQQLINKPCCDPIPRTGCADPGFVPAPVYRGIGTYGQSYQRQLTYQGVDGNPQKIIMPYQNSVYNVKRYIDTPYHPQAPHIAPRSSVW